MSTRTQNHESLSLQRATIEGLPAQTIEDLKKEFLEHAPESMQKKYAGWFTYPRLPTLFVVWAFDVRAKRQGT